MTVEERRAKNKGQGIPDSILSMRLLNANPRASVTGLDELRGKTNYFIGKDPKNWRTNVPNYAKVKYESVYPGVNLIYYGNQRHLEYDFVLAPGADLNVITLAMETGDGKLENGNAKLETRIAANGDLIIKTGGREVRFHKPVVYQKQSTVDSSQLTVQDNGQLTTDH